MAVTAPLRIPVEIRRGPAVAAAANKAAPKVSGPRWFRTARGVSELGMHFGRALPEEADGPLTVSFVLPDGDDARLSLSARAVSVETGDEAEPEARLAVRFIAPEDEPLARIARYVAARVPAEGA